MRDEERFRRSAQGALALYTMLRIMQDFAAQYSSGWHYQPPNKVNINAGLVLPETVSGIAALAG
jgi:hypothetical protein